jgi:hypothetical protein
MQCRLDCTVNSKVAYFDDQNPRRLLHRDRESQLHLYDDDEIDSAQMRYEIV